MKMRNIFRERFNKIALIAVPYRLFVTLQNGFGFNLRFVAGLRAVAVFLVDFLKYIRNNNNPYIAVRSLYMTPCLLDRTVVTPLEPTYFYQDTWAAGKIFRLNPGHHYDVGSSVMTVGIISQFVPTTMIDIRSIELKLKNLSFQEGSIVNLPFLDNSIESLSSLCVVEHIGLGRYGDPVDPWGSEKASRELVRVLALGGTLLVSVPIDSDCRVYFNAHRAFTPEYVLEMFSGLKLMDTKFLYGSELQDNYDVLRGFGTGMFHFTKVHQ